MSGDGAAPTVVLNEISYDGGQEGYRVILCNGADVFGETGDHVAETIAESEADLENAVLTCKLHLEGWDAIEDADPEWLWDHRPDRLQRSSRHFAGAVIDDVYSELPTPDSDIAESGAEINESDSEPCNKLHSSDSDISACGEESTRIRGDAEQSIRIEQDDCSHLPEYRIDGECLRCEQAFNTSEERDVQDGVVS